MNNVDNVNSFDGNKTKNKNWLIILITIILVLAFPVLCFIKFNIDLHNASVLVPFSAVDIGSDSKITDDMIGYIEISSKEFESKYDGKIYLSADDIIGMCSSTEINRGDYFEIGALVECSQ